LLSQQTHHALPCCVLQAHSAQHTNNAPAQGSNEQQHQQQDNPSGIVSLMQAWGQLSTRLQQPAAPADPSAGAAARQSNTAAGQSNAAAEDDVTQLILSALKLAVRSLSRVPAAAGSSNPASSNRPAVQRSLALAAALAELYANGLPLDAASIAAGIVAEAVDVAALHIRSVQAKLGPEVAGLVHDVLAVRHATDRVQLYDDAHSRCAERLRMKLKLCCVCSSSLARTCCNRAAQCATSCNIDILGLVAHFFTVKTASSRRASVLCRLLYPVCIGWLAVARLGMHQRKALAQWLQQQLHCLCPILNLLKNARLMPLAPILPLLCSAVLARHTSGCASMCVLLLCSAVLCSLQQMSGLPTPACSALRGWLLSAYDVRACAIEVVWRWLGLVQPPGLPHQQQLQALEALTIYCPLGHALGLGGCSAALEDAAFKVGGVSESFFGSVLQYDTVHCAFGPFEVSGGY
jgi:hypothetical protein